MEKKDSSPGAEKPDEFGVFPDEYCRFNDLLAAKIGAPVWARVKICWRVADQKRGMAVLSPMYAFGILFGNLVKKLEEFGAKREEIGRLYSFSNKQKIDLFLSKDLPLTLFDLGFSDDFIGVACNVFGLKNTAFGKVRVAAGEVRESVVGATTGTSWLPVSRADEALVGGVSDNDAAGLVDTLHKDDHLSGAASLEEDEALAPTGIMTPDFEDVLKEPKK